MQAVQGALVGTQEEFWKAVLQMKSSWAELCPAHAEEAKEQLNPTGIAEIWEANTHQSTFHCKPSKAS